MGKRARTGKTHNHNSFALVLLGSTQSSNLAFLSEVLCEFFQLLQVLIINCWLCVGLRPQHISLQMGRLKKKRRFEYVTIWKYVANAVFYICTMETTGSNSFSPGTFIHVISIALGSPGEQGVRRSSTVTLGSSLDGPRTLK